MQDRRRRDRAGQRAAASELLVGLSRLDRGDPDREELRRQVIAEYMPFARHLASRYAAGNQPAEDLRQVAYVGLVKAVDRFDPGYGTAFLGYATPVILGELKRYFRDASWPVHVPRRIQELYSDVWPAAETLMHRLSRDPTAEELAGLLGSRPQDVMDAIDAASLRTVTSLDLPVDTDHGPGSALGDLLGAEDPELQQIVDRETLRPLLAALSAREKKILLMTFFQEMTQAQIGAELGVSQMQVSRLLTAILGRLRRRAGVEPEPSAGIPSDRPAPPGPRPASRRPGTAPVRSGRRPAPPGVGQSPSSRAVVGWGPSPQTPAASNVHAIRASGRPRVC